MTNLTLLDWTKRVDPDGTISDIGELLHQTNDIRKHAVIKEGNLPTGHQETVRTSLSEPQWRSFNQGVIPSKTTTSQIQFTSGMLEDWSECDVKLAKLNGNVDAFRVSEARGKLEGMNQKWDETIFYGNPATDPQAFLGLAPQYASLSAANAQNIISSTGGSNNNTSVWLLVWGDNTIFQFFPKGGMAGLEHEDLGIETAQDVNGVAGSRMRVYQDRFGMDGGLCVKDWRYGVRICNLQVGTAGSNDVNRLVGVHAADQTTNLLHLMLQAIARIPNLDMGRACWAMNRTAMSALQRMAYEKGAPGGLRVEEAASQFGGPSFKAWHFMGVPIAQCDAILNTEAQVA